MSTSRYVDTPLVVTENEFLRRKCEAAEQHAALLETRLRRLKRFIAARAIESEGILAVSDYAYQKTSPDVTVTVTFDARLRCHLLRVGSDAVADMRANGEDGQVK